MTALRDVVMSLDIFSQVPVGGLSNSKVLTVRTFHVTTANKASVWHSSVMHSCTEMLQFIYFIYCDLNVQRG